MWSLVMALYITSIGLVILYVCVVGRVIVQRVRFSFTGNTTVSLEKRGGFYHVCGIDGTAVLLYIPVKMIKNRINIV